MQNFRTLALLLVMTSLPIVCLFSSPDKTKRHEHAVLEKLFQAAGHYNFKLPKLKITRENKKVAAYYPSTNTIILDEKAIQLCRSFGKDSTNALAFLLSHELSHSFQVEIRNNKTSTNFLSYDQHYHSSTRIEKVADIQGLFTAYLAGYQPGHIIPGMLEKLYTAYDLMGKEIKGYPTLQERKNTAAEVLDITNLLIDLFESSNYLLVSGQYSLAAVNLEYILKYYQGREVYNNLGVMYLLAALDYYNPATDRYVYPMELDASTQLKKIANARGEQRLSASDRQIRIRLLEKAQSSFNQAIQLDKNYFSARLNLACTLNLWEKPAEALNQLQKDKLLTSSKKDKLMQEKVKLALAITHALLNDQLAAQSLLNEIAYSKNQLHTIQAKFNLDVLNNREFHFLTGHFFEFPEEFRLLMKTIQMGRVSQVTPLPLDEGGTVFRKVQNGGSTTYSFGNIKGSLVTLVRFRNTQALSVNLLDFSDPVDKAFFHNLVAAQDGYYLKAEEDGFVLKIGQQGNVVEMARVFIH